MESYGISQSERLTSKELAKLLDVHQNCLYQWRQQGKGPPYIRIVGRIYYPKGAFEEWLRDSIHNGA